MLKNGKVNFTTTINSELLEKFREKCWEHEVAMNIVLEKSINEFLRKEVKE